jgi:hypothetical protein
MTNPIPIMLGKVISGHEIFLFMAVAQGVTVSQRKALEVLPRSLQCVYTYMYMYMYIYIDV